MCSNFSIRKIITFLTPRVRVSDSPTVLPTEHFKCAAIARDEDGFDVRRAAVVRGRLRASGLWNRTGVPRNKNFFILI
jgi:hypothetical protein